jgi:hypothetical protein
MRLTESLSRRVWLRSSAEKQMMPRSLSQLRQRRDAAGDWADGNKDAHWFFGFQRPPTIPLLWGQR